MKKYPIDGINTINDPLNKPGLTWGNITLVNVWNLLAPKSWAASINELSIFSQADINGNIMNGNNV